MVVAIKYFFIFRLVFCLLDESETEKVAATTKKTVILFLEGLPEGAAVAPFATAKGRFPLDDVAFPAKGTGLSYE